jgi:hypothetical protein
MVYVLEERIYGRPISDIIKYKNKSASLLKRIDLKIIWQ